MAQAMRNPVLEYYPTNTKNRERQYELKVYTPNRCRFKKESVKAVHNRPGFHLYRKQFLVEPCKLLTKVLK